MAINFPNSPNVGDVFTVNNLQYEWNGSAWISVNLVVQSSFDKANAANISADAAVKKVGNTMTGNLVMSDANIAFTIATNSGIYWSDTSFIYSSAANVIVLGTSSTEDLRIDSTGNVSISSKLGIGTSTPRAKFEIFGSSVGGITTLVDNTTITPDFSSNNYFTITLGGNRTLANATNTIPGQSGIIYVIQDATGGRSLSFGLAYKFVDNSAPTLTTTANAVDAIIYSVRSANSYICQSMLNVGNRNDT